MPRVARLRHAALKRSASPDLPARRSSDGARRSHPGSRDGPSRRARGLRQKTSRGRRGATLSRCRPAAARARLPARVNGRSRARARPTPRRAPCVRARTRASARAPPVRTDTVRARANSCPSVPAGDRSRRATSKISCHDDQCIVGRFPISREYFVRNSLRSFLGAHDVGKSRFDPVGGHKQGVERL